MKKKLIILFIFIYSTIFCSAQQSESIKGYYITNTEERIECLIYNFDFEYSPVQIKVKKDQNSDFSYLSSATIKEFGFLEKSRNIFKRFTVSIDQSSDNLSKLSNDSKSNYVQKVLFLEQLVSGKANLFVYRENDLTRYFYTISDSDIEQLEYKKYFFENAIYENRNYRQQLFNLFKDNGVSQTDIENVDYKEGSLTTLFNKYNAFFGIQNKMDDPLKEKSKIFDFNLSVRPRVNFSSAEFENFEDFYGTASFGMKTNFGIGLEFEVVFYDKFSFFIEPTYRNYKNTGVQIVGNLAAASFPTQVEYNSIEIPLGFRRYFRVEKNLNMFANVAVQFDKLLSPEYQAEINPDTELKSGLNVGLGMGIKYKNKFVMELKYDSPRKLTTLYADRTSKFQNFSVILGYNLL
jgi:Outer membrane protein beta-barrel domain